MVDDILEESTTAVAGRGITNAAVGAVGATAILGGVMNKVPRLSELQQVAMLGEEERKEELKEQLVKFVNRTVFPSTKFPLGREKEEKLCRIAAYRLKVKLPAGVDRQVFGTKFFMTVRLRMNKLRSNTHGAAKAKFESKCN